MAVTSLIDLLSAYDQIPLAEEDRDMTAIHTPLGQLRQTTPLQEATDSVAHFVRTMSKILEEIMPDNVWVGLSGFSELLTGSAMLTSCSQASITISLSGISD